MSPVLKEKVLKALSVRLIVDSKGNKGMILKWCKKVTNYHLEFPTQEKKLFKMKTN
jgi:hypothetical protein